MFIRSLISAVVALLVGLAIVAGSLTFNPFVRERNVWAPELLGVGLDLVVISAFVLLISSLVERFFQGPISNARQEIGKAQRDLNATLEELYREIISTLPDSTARKYVKSSLGIVPHTQAFRGAPGYSEEGQSLAEKLKKPRRKAIESLQRFADERNTAERFLGDAINNKLLKDVAKKAAELEKTLDGWTVGYDESTEQRQKVLTRINNFLNLRIVS